jgi:peptide/nickel transport system permease protein
VTDMISPETASTAETAAAAPGLLFAGPEAVVLLDGAPTTKKLGLFFWLCAGWIGLIIVVAIFANLLPLPKPNFQNFSAPQNGSPGLGHLLGTDDLNRDIFSRLLYGARVSLVVGFGGTGIGLVLGGIPAMFSAYRRGRVDTFLNTVSYAVLAFPALVAVIAIGSFWGHDLWKITLVIGVFSAPVIFRVVRASTLSYASRDFVMAAKALGASDSRILAREIFPNILPTIVSFGLIAVATVIVLEGTLAFLGLSVPPPTPSWGNMLNEGAGLLSGGPGQSNPWLVIFPAAAMFSLLFTLNVVADKLRSYFDVTEVKL